MKPLEKITAIHWPDAYADSNGRAMLLGKTGYWGENKFPQLLSKPNTFTGTFRFVDESISLKEVFFIAAETEPINA